MPAPLFQTSVESSKEYPVLLVDKDGEVAYALAEVLKKTALPVVISRTLPQDSTVIHLPFISSFPRLPQNAFAGIIVIYKGEKATASQLNRLIKKAKETNAPLLLVSDRDNAKESLLKKVTTYHNGRVVLYGDVFGVASIPSPTEELLVQAARKKHLVLSNSGLSMVYPLSFPDLIQLILEIFLGQSPFNYYFLSSKPRTQLSFVRLLQNIEPLIRVDFREKKRTFSSSVPPTSAKVVHPLTLPLQERLRDAFLTLSEQEERKVLVRKRVKRKRTKWEKAIFCAVLLLIFPLVTIITALSIGFASLGVSAFSFEKGRLPLAEKAAYVSFQAFEIARPSEELLQTVAERSTLPITVIPYVDQMASGRKSAELLLAVSRAALLLEKSFIKGGLPDGESVRVLLKKAVFALQELQAQELLPLSYREKIREDERAISFLASLVDKIPSLFGFEGKKTYALLLQDNTELRAGGGLIRSVGLVTLLNGRVAEFQLSDVYTLDGALKGHKEPPFFLNRYMGASHWFLRDSNVFLDSAQNATEAASFLTLETGKSVDGLIATDLSFLRSLLKEVGTVQVGKSKQAISSDTLFSQAVASQNQVGTEKGDDFFVSLTKSLFAKLEKTPLPPITLGRLISQGIWQKHLLLTSLDPAVQPLLLRSKSVSTPIFLPEKDVFGIIENNIGGNKASYFLKRSIMHTISLQEDRSASSSVLLLYTNTAAEETEGGEYRGYVNVLLPKESTLLSVDVNGTPQQIIPAITDPEEYRDPAFKEPKGLEVTEEELYGQKVYGFLLTVKEKEERLVTLTYATRNVLAPSASQVVYPLYFFKQPGVEIDDYTLSLSYPRKYQPVRAPEGAVKKKGSLLLEKLIREDEVFVFEFATRN